MRCRKGCQLGRALLGCCFVIRMGGGRMEEGGGKTNRPSDSTRIQPSHVGSPPEGEYKYRIPMPRVFNATF